MADNHCQQNLFDFTDKFFLPLPKENTKRILLGRQNTPCKSSLITYKNIIEMNSGTISCPLLDDKMH